MTCMMTESSVGKDQPRGERAGVRGGAGVLRCLTFILCGWRIAMSVSDELRRSALRKLFGLPRFNFCDGLDDYAEDFTRFEPLGDLYGRGRAALA